MPDNSNIELILFLTLSLLLVQIAQFLKPIGLFGGILVLFVNTIMIVLSIPNMSLHVMCSVTANTQTTINHTDTRGREKKRFTLLR